MKRFGSLTLCAVLLLALAAFSQGRARHLILKDGSYQAATKWEVKGDRVRYFSAERFIWEELPTALIDWNATEKYTRELEHPPGGADSRPKLEAESKAEAALYIVPGVRLPDNGGVFLLDNFQKRPSLVELVQNGGELNRQMGRNILRSIILPLPTSARQSVELKGSHARVQAHSASPQLFVNINYDESDDIATAKAKSGAAGSETEDKPDIPRLERFRIVRLQALPKNNKRRVSNLKVALTGKIKEQRNVIAAEVEPLSNDWLKVVPSAPLEPGEYALIEMLTPAQMNLYVWDFGVDPSAPANPTAWKPEKPVPTKTGTDESPVLTERKKK